MTVEFHAAFHAAGRFFEIERYIGANIAAAAHAASSSTTSAAEKIAKHAAAEQVAENLKDIFGTLKFMVLPLHPGMAITIVSGTLIGIAQHFVGFGAFFEFVGDFFIAVVGIGMILHGELAIRRGDFLARGIALHVENFVIAAFCRHNGAAILHRAVCESSRGETSPATLIIRSKR